MKSHKIWGALLTLGLLEGCKEDPSGCVQDADCTGEQFCHTETRQCTGPRYTALNLPTLSENTVVGGGVLRVQAVLALQAGARPVYPSRLELTVTPVSGGAASVVDLTATTPEGTYTGEWTPPAGEATYTFRVASSEPGVPERSVKVTVDRTAPALALTVPPASHEAREGFSYMDPMAATAWARDQTVTMRLESEATDFDATSARVVVQGHAGGTNVTDLAVTQVTPCARAWCGAVDVPLWRPGLEAFRGTFQVDVTGKDRVGNEGTARTSIPVTRWKWAFDGASGAILSSPAIGEKGTVYFGTSGTGGKVFALNPEGTRKWEAQLGPVRGSPAVKPAPDGTEHVYVGASTDSGGILFGLDGTGKTSGQCPEQGRKLNFGPILSGTLLLETATTPGSPTMEAAIAFSSGSTVLILNTATGACSSASSFNTPLGSSLIGKGNDFYYSVVDASDPSDEWYFLSALHFVNGSRGNKPGYDQPQLNASATGMALAQTNNDTHILASLGTTSPLSGGIQVYNSETGRGPSWTYPRSMSGVPPVRNLILSAGNVVYFGHEVATGAAPLTAIELFATAPRISIPSAGSFPGAPVLGATGTLYTASATGTATDVGEVSAWRADNLALHWKLNDSVGRAQVSPALDCSRQPDGAPMAQDKGILYVPAIDGHLYALVVDSPGLDKTAPWPKYQHDARNSGNFSSPITNCP
ncbi:PQQ-binding-like beta-propeller repeat protein [Melittangium boletus]|uniref:PQQ-binding-like beta-propeller repeat protein n=1 Tax=Melittangium boletus TaxID=83453 RepID=UPI003DA51FDC